MEGVLKLQDLFFEQNYGKLYESIEDGVCEVFNFENSLGKVRHLFLKRKIPILLEGKYYFDLATPYGYGGPLISSVKGSNKQRLIEQFHTAFHQYCSDNNVVSEFIRFHPLFFNAHDFKDIYNVQHRRCTTGTNLLDFEDPIQAEFSKSTKRNIRKAIKEGVTFKVTLYPSDLKDFKNIYYETMNRNNADSIYYFTDEYFSDCLRLLGKHLVLTEVLYRGKTIGMGLSFIYNQVIHTHLSGTLEEYHHLSPAYVLQYALALWGKNNGFHLIHDGGGRTADPDDTLFLFKKQFGKNTEFQYFVGQKIWNNEIYQKLCDALCISNDSGIFPAYRTIK